MKRNAISIIEYQSQEQIRFYELTAIYNSKFLTQQSQPWCQPQDNLIKPKLFLTGLDFVQYPYMIVQQLFSLLRNRLTMRLKEKLTTEPPPRKEKEPRWQNW